MKTTSFLVAASLAAALALPMVAKAGPAPQPKFEAEKCYGVAKAGQERLPDGELVVRRDLEERQSGRCVDLRASGHLRQARGWQHQVQNLVACQS